MLLCIFSPLSSSERMPLTLIYLFGAAVHDRLLRTCDDFVWPVDSTFHGRFIIDVEFLDLRICPLNVSSFMLSF